ncbi:hypothetical protein [Herbidospora cretacea]|uniref:hypothetical protein n=1 Tax=Herbidospora cretacea TaxID=28444 RepID=UPI0004C393E1|nr:hypothetical protein [Herbidospora cretacea]
MTTAPARPEGPAQPADHSWIVRLRAIVRAGGPSAAAQLGDLLAGARAHLGASHPIALRIAAATERELSRTRQVDETVAAWSAVHAEAGVSLGPDDPVTMEIASGHLRWLARRARPDDLRRAVTAQRAELARRRETLGRHDHWTGVARADLAVTLLTLPLLEPDTRRTTAEAAELAAEEAARRAAVLGGHHVLTWEARALEASARLAATGPGTTAKAAWENGPGPGAAAKARPENGGEPGTKAKATWEDGPRPGPAKGRPETGGEPGTKGKAAWEDGPGPGTAARARPENGPGPGTVAKAAWENGPGPGAGAGRAAGGRGGGSRAEVVEHALAVAEACVSLGGPLDAGRQIRAALLTAEAHLAADRPRDAERAARLAAGLFAVRSRPWWGGADPGRPWVVIARTGARADAAGHAARALSERSRWFPADSLWRVEVTRLLHTLDGR